MTRTRMWLAFILAMLCTVISGFEPPGPDRQMGQLAAHIWWAASLILGAIEK